MDKTNNKIPDRICSIIHGLLIIYKGRLLVGETNQETYFIILFNIKLHSSCCFNLGHFHVISSFICKCKDRMCRMIHTCSRRSLLQSSSQNPHSTSGQGQHHQWWSECWWWSQRHSSQGTSRILHSRCRTCSRRRSHSFHHSKTCSFGNWEKNRSEERRVGKECRSRWSPYH